MEKAVVFVGAMTREAESVAAFIFYCVVVRDRSREKVTSRNDLKMFLLFLDFFFCVSPSGSEKTSSREEEEEEKLTVVVVGFLRENAGLRQWCKRSGRRVSSRGR